MRNVRSVFVKKQKCLVERYCRSENQVSHIKIVLDFFLVGELLERTQLIKRVVRKVWNIGGACVYILAWPKYWGCY